MNLIGPVFALSRCPLCRVRPNQRAGCCKPCEATLFELGSDGHVLWLGPYRGTLEQAVRALKYHRASRLAELLGCKLGAEVKAKAWPIDMVSFVPLHPLRKLKRGYNQARLLSRWAARELGCANRGLLSRRRITRQQAKLGKKARLSNVANAFTARPGGKLAGRRILLVDDVLTSGATTMVCREALLTAGAAQVYIACVAKANLVR